MRLAATGSEYALYAPLLAQPILSRLREFGTNGFLWLKSAAQYVRHTACDRHRHARQYAAQPPIPDRGPAAFDRAYRPPVRVSPLRRPISRLSTPSLAPCVTSSCCTVLSRDLTPVTHIPAGVHDRRMSPRARRQRSRQVFPPLSPARRPPVVKLPPHLRPTISPRPRHCGHADPSCRGPGRGAVPIAALD
jgi:hypothetical protein